MRSAHRQQGITLVEVLVSLVLFAVAIVGLLRTLGTAMRDSGEVEFRTVAANLASARLGAMWIDRSNLANYVETDTALTELPNGTRTVTVAGSVVSIVIHWQVPGSDAQRTYSTMATLAVNN
jgi:prepilin-type N-terminal cleavage/methylation domain-containing protein